MLSEYHSLLWHLDETANIFALYAVVPKLCPIMVTIELPVVGMLVGSTKLIAKRSQDIYKSVALYGTSQDITALKSAIGTDEDCLQATDVCESHSEIEQAVLAILTERLRCVQFKFEPHIKTTYEPVKEDE